MQSGTTEFSGRSRELGMLRRALDGAQASLLLVAGLPGVGKTRLVRRAAADYPTMYHRAPPLPELRQREALARSIVDALGPSALSSSRSGGAGAGGAGAGTPSWEELFAALPAAAPEGRPLVLVVDDAHRWDGSRARFRAALGGMLSRSRRDARAVHVVLVSPEILSGAVPDETPALELTLPPLPFRAAAALLPGETPLERFRAWTVFGGIPANLAQVDPGTSLGANLRRLVLSAEGPLAEAPLTLLERAFQNPTRYVAILAALAGGEGDWGTVQAGVPDLSASGQAAPYLKRLEEVGLVEARRSLDASPAARSRRYRIRDPFTAFWFRFVLPHRHRLGEGTADALLAEVVRPGLDAHAGTLFAEACRDFMAHDAREVLGANARECGSLWGSGYDIPVAGTLATGAPFYGMPVPPSAHAGSSTLRALDAQVRETRYGFGRERRLRLLFTQADAPSSLQREAARRHDVAVVGLDTLAGAGS
ncbi:MAG: ATP-binding protein [Longimicrobiales bacterium]